MRALWLALLLAITTCSGSDAPATPPVARAPSVEPSPRVEPPPTPEPPRPSVPVGPSLRSAEGLAALREARTLARAGDFEQAWARLDPLTESAGATPSFRCEAGYVAFRAGHLDRAMPLVRAAADAYAPPADREGRAALARCLYNVGLVSEAAGDLRAAVDAYQRSFSLRANATVYEHLAAAAVRLDGVSDASETERVTAIVARAIGPGADFEALAQALTEHCSAQRYHPSSCSATVTGRWRAPGGGALIEAALIRAVLPSETYLAIRDAGGARLVGSVRAEHLPDTSPDVLSARFEDVLPAAGSELVLDLQTLADVSDPGGNDCDPEERGCDGTTRRAARRDRVICAAAAEGPACIVLQTMDLLYEHDGYVAMPCDRAAPALPFGVGWTADVSIAPSGALSTTTRAITSEGERCPDDDEPAPNEASLDADAIVRPPRPPPARAGVPFATLATESPLPRRFPQPPVTQRPPALGFLQPWWPPDASSVDPAPLDDLVRGIESSCEIEQNNAAPRCCGWDGSCEARVEARLASGADEVAIVSVVCEDVDIGESEIDHHLRVLTRRMPDGDHRVLGTLQSLELERGRTLPAITQLRFEDALPSPGLEARLSFRHDVARPATDARTRIAAEVRSITEVDVICTAGERARCHVLPVVYQGRQLAADEAGRDAVIGATSYRVEYALSGDRVTFTTREGTPPAALTGERAIGDVPALRPWGAGEPEAYY